MSKTTIALIFIFAGVAYGSLAFDYIYNITLGYLVKYDWIRPPVPGEKSLQSIFGRKSTILLYSGILIIIGLYLLWNRNN